MRDILIDIRQKIKDGVYKNEEHIRLGVVARILSQLGWNIWDPIEVNCEFNPVPSEDRTRVDIALFSTPRIPAVFIEVKPLGSISVNLPKVETQLRNYNRDNTALFSIITDGQIWRFYLSQTGGKFSEKCFKIVNLLEDDLDAIQASLGKFLNKQEIADGNSEQEAKKTLRLTEKQRTMGEMLPRARKTTMESPFPRLPEALVTLVAQEGFPITTTEAETFIEKSKEKDIQETETKIKESQLGSYRERTSYIAEEMEINPDNPPNLAFTKISEAKFADKSANNWNNLLECAINAAIQKHMSIEELQNLSITIHRGGARPKGYKPIPRTDISFLNLDANRVWYSTLKLAKKLQTEVMVRFAWRDKEKAAHPGKKAHLQWNP